MNRQWTVLFHDPSVAARAFLVCLLAFWLPLPYASVTPLCEAIFEVGIFVLFAIAAASTGWQFRRWAALPLAGLGGLGAFGVLQSLPWPSALAGRLSPGHAHLWEQARSLVPQVETAVPLSLAPFVTRGAALLVLAAAAAFATGAVIGRDRLGRRALGATVVVAALFQVLFGARHWMAGVTTIWGREVGGDSMRLRGTFVNADHFALYLEMAMPIVFAWGWWAFRRVLDQRSPEQMLIRVAPPALAWVVLIAGVAFSGSRAGLVAAIVATVAQGLLLAARARHWRVGASGVLAIAVGLGIVAAIGLQEGLGRWLATSRHELAWNQRVQIWGAAVELWRSFPLLGTGLGTFREAAPLVGAAEGSAAWWHAHNDVLELLATGGLVGIALAAIALGGVLARLLRVLHNEVHGEERAAAIAALGALVAVTIHSLFDFGMTMPANSGTLALLAGAACAAAYHERPSSTS